MVKHGLLVLLLFFFVSCAQRNTSSSADQYLEWNDWTPDLFERAKKENKLVLLDLKANWCHWCHVMDDSTYRNGNVIAYLNENFIVAEADHDARPDLAARYRQYGWPATIIFNSAGEEISKRAGFMEPGDFLALLKTAVGKPVAEKEPRKNNFTVNTRKNYLTTQVVPLLKKKNQRFIDPELGGFDQAQKYIDWSTFEYALAHYNEDKRLERWLKNTMVNAQGIMDDAWGGVYQYSTYGDWKHPHYEKLLSVQARYIKMYAWYARMFNDESALQTAEKIAGYCFRFLWNEGKGFFSAQDADLNAGEKATWYFNLTDKERLKAGIPPIDRHVFTSTNGMMVRSLVVLWAATGKEKYLESANQMITYMLTHRRTPDGGFWHYDNENDIKALADNIPMTDALLMMYRATGKKYFLEEAVATAEFIHATFSTGKGNYYSDKTHNGLKPQIVLDENIELCRLFNLLAGITGDSTYKKRAHSVFGYIISSETMSRISTEPGILLAYEELQEEPVTGTLLVYKENNETKNLIKEMTGYPRYYFSTHVYKPNHIPADKKELFSSFNQNILFFCTSKFCSSPVNNVAEARDFLYKN